LSRVFNTVDGATHAKSVVKHDPLQPLQGHKVIEATDSEQQYNVTPLNNGFTVLTESASFPGAVHMGFLIDVGTRDETPETSGACLAIKNTYLKTLKHTNETINYGMIQMSGGAMTMDYDQERIMFKGHCIEYDTIDMFQMLTDIALEPKSVMSANVAKSKNKKSHELFNHLSKFDPFASQQENLLRTAYGINTLGMPRLGLGGNVDNVDARMLGQFVMDDITPKKCLIVASGVQNHNEYVELVKERIGDLAPLPEQNFVREESKYLGGEMRTWAETPVTNITLAFESGSWTNDDVYAYYVMNTLIGSAQGFSSGGPGKGMHCRAITNMMQRHSFVDSASALNHHFSDSGLFGMSIEGPGSHSSDLMNVLVDEINGLRKPIDEVELNRAKNVLKMQVLMAMERTEDRVEELARNYMTYGTLTLHNYCDQIDNVTSDQINRVASSLVQGRPTLLVSGGAINLVPSVTDVSRQLN